MYQAITQEITVKVEPFYLEDRSSPDEGYYVWAYRVQIENNGEDTVQLRSRYWHITDAEGRVQEVSGEGVVGEQPVLEPGESYEYTSGTPLSSPSGMMMGRYHMEGQSGGAFDVDIPAFSLDSPHDEPSLN